MKIGLFDRSRIPLLEKEMDLFVARNKAIANNVANIATPGYKTVNVGFKHELSNAIANSTNDVQLSEEIKNIQPAIQVDNSGTLDSGANNINIDQQMADLAKNQLQFKMAARLTSITLQMIDKSINGV